MHGIEKQRILHHFNVERAVSKVNANSALFLRGSSTKIGPNNYLTNIPKGGFLVMLGVPSLIKLVDNGGTIQYK